ncbi:MAG: cyclic nucleotide-binding domain-containing protein [Lachnospiraceae bacterium]|nr:cyclic nucleotide-binding domain-containing protein [Lachnospiraceae bacterium]
MYQDIFIYRCSKNTSYTELESLFNRLADSVTVRIRDISHGAFDERANVFSSIIAALHKRDAYHDETPLITVLKTADNEYFLLLSINCDVKEEVTESILANVFHSNNFETLRLLGGSPHSKQESEKYWAGILEDEEALPVGMVANARCTRERAEEVLTVSPDITGALRNPANNNINLESLCATIWGSIACKYFEAESILIESKHENGKLFRIPLKVDTTSKFIDSYAFTEMQFRNALDYDNLFFDELEAASSCDFAASMAFSVGFYNRYRYAPLLRTLHAGIPYKLRHLESSDMPMRIYCHYSDTIMRIRYNYDVGLVKNAGIFSIHSAFSDMLERFLSSSRNVNVNKIFLRPDKESPEQRNKEFISNTLAKSEMFRVYDPRDLDKFSSKCSRVSKFSEETILEEGKLADALYMLTSGKIVVETVGKDRTVKIIHVLRPGNVFGIECLLNDPTVDFTYRAVTELVELIRIPKNLLKDELTLHPKLNTIIMNIQSNQLNKLAKLLASKDVTS